MIPISVLDLDGVDAPAIDGLDRPIRRIDARDWGPILRLASTHRAFRRFRLWLDDGATGRPRITVLGSGDFHHVSLALLGRIRGPFNLLVLDKHPDWMGGIPILHCGTWLRHALALPNLRRVFHVGGEMDFDNGYRHLAPWRALRSGRVVVLPARRRYRAGRWSTVATRPLSADGGAARPDDLRAAIRPYADDLRRVPLYVSFDKDVLTRSDAVVNWDSGLIGLDEAIDALRAFLDAAENRLAGADLLGDWSPIRLGTAVNRVAEWADRPDLPPPPADWRCINRRSTAAILAALLGASPGDDAPARLSPRSLRIDPQETPAMTNPAAPDIPEPHRRSGPPPEIDPAIPNPFGPDEPHTRRDDDDDAPPRYPDPAVPIPSAIPLDGDDIAPDEG